MPSPVATCRSNNSPSNCTASGKPLQRQAKIYRHLPDGIIRRIKSQCLEKLLERLGGFAFLQQFFATLYASGDLLPVSPFLSLGHGKRCPPETPKTGAPGARESRGVVQLKILGSRERSGNAVPHSAITKVTLARVFHSDNYSSKRFQRFSVSLARFAALSWRRARCVSPGAYECVLMMLAAILYAARPTNLLALPAIGIAFGLFWFYKGFRLLQRKRLIQNTPASKIRSASMGLVEVSGLAAGPHVLTSPFKQAESFYYRSTAWQLKQQGKNTQWVKVAEEILHVPFYLDDNTAKVLIDPRGAEMDLHCDMSEQYHRSVLFSGPEMPGPVAEFLIRHGVDPDKRIKVEEYCIKPKNFLFVLGTLSQNPGLDASIRPTWAEPSDRNRHSRFRQNPRRQWL